MQTITVKNEKGEGFELPYIYAMPRPVYKNLAKAREIVFEITEATQALKGIEKDDEHFEEKVEFQTKRLKQLQESYDLTFDRIDEGFAEFFPGWKEFAYGLSMRAWSAVVGKVLGTEASATSEIYKDSKLDFLLPQ